MSTYTLDTMTVGQLRDLAERATNAANAQEAEQQRKAEEAAKAAEAEKKKPVFEHGQYSLDRDGKIRYDGGIPSIFNGLSGEELVSRMKERAFPASSDYVKFAEFIVAYGKHLEKERYQQPALSGLSNQFNNTNYLGATLKF